jgi:hypothetical protein
MHLDRLEIGLDKFTGFSNKFVDGIIWIYNLISISISISISSRPIPAPPW